MNSKKLIKKQNNIKSYLVWQLIPGVAKVLLESLEGVDQTGRAEKVLLLQPQEFPLLGRVVGIQDGADHSGQAKLLGRLLVASQVKRLQVQVLDWVGLPQSHVTHVLRLVSGLWIIPSLRVVYLRWLPGPLHISRPSDLFLGYLVLNYILGALDRLSHFALRLFGLGFLTFYHRLAPVFYQVPNIGSLHLEWVTLGIPLVTDLVLSIVLDDLLKHTILISDSVAHPGVVTAGQTFYIAGSEPTQTSITQGGIPLLYYNILETVAVLFERLTIRLLDVQVDQSVGQHSAHQKLGGEIIDHLGSL